MRRQPNNKLKEYLLEIASNYTVDELLPIVNKKFKEKYKKEELRKYLWRNKIPHKYTNEKKIRNNVNKKPIGTEYTKPDGMILVKTNNDKWVYKQRLIYEKYHNVKLKEDEYVIFLDEDRTNFNINNLKVVTRQESSYLANFKFNHKICLKSKEGTETLLLIARLIIKVKNINK